MCGKGLMSPREEVEGGSSVCGRRERGVSREGEWKERVWEGRE